MHIVTLSTWKQGGAAITEQRLSKELISSGVRVTSLHMESRLLSYIDAAIGKLLKSDNPIFHSFNYFDSGIVDKINALKPDIVHIHWVGAGFLSPESIDKIKAPLVWTLHDLWPLSGAEHLPGSMDRYTHGYLASNRPSSESGLDLNRYVWERKRKAWAKKNITFVAPSRYVFSLATKSALSKKHHLVEINNGIELSKFKHVKSIPKENIILFSAPAAIVDKNKGFDLLVDALSQIPVNLRKTMSLYIAGASKLNENKLSRIGIKSKYLGNLTESRLIYEYQRALITVIPSRMETLSYTAMESLACGTPVIAFNVGGIPELVTHEVSGYLVKPYDTHLFAHYITKLLNSEGKAKEMGEVGREHVTHEYNLIKTVQLYNRLYRQIYDSL